MHSATTGSFTADGPSGLGRQLFEGEHDGRKGDSLYVEVRSGSGVPGIEHCLDYIRTLFTKKVRVLRLAGKATRPWAGGEPVVYGR